MKREAIALVAAGVCDADTIDEVVKTGFGARYYSVDFSQTNHAKVAEAYGIRTWRVEDPADLKPALAKAIAADVPTLVDIVAQPLHEAKAPVSEWVA